MSIHVLIPAGGTGTRFDASVPKQFHVLNGRPVLAWSVRAFLQSPEIDAIWILHSPEVPELGRAALTQLLQEYPKQIRLLDCAGDTRAHTVQKGAEALRQSLPLSDNPWVLVHDAARPGLTLAALQRLLQHLEKEDVGAILALPAVDTLKEAVGNRIQKTIPRQMVWQAQTPQAFRLDTLLTALSGDLEHFSDEASAIEALGLSPALVLGDSQNFKLTHPEDARLMASLLGDNA